MSYNLYRVYAPDHADPRVTVASDNSFTARKWYAEGHGFDITDVVGIRIREGDEVQVRDKRDNAIAITKAKLSRVKDSSTAIIEVIEDDILADNSIGVPVSCIEPLGEKVPDRGGVATR